MSAAAPRAADVLRRDLSPEGGVAAFCADLVRLPSPSGDEERVVRRVIAQMQALQLDEASVDATGNAVGLVRSRHARRSGRCLVLNSHVDHVDPGDPSAWTDGPFSASVRDGRLYGRGATDAKSCVAAQVHAAGLLRVLRDEGVVDLRHDVVVTAVVQEEVGGLGTAGLLESGLDAAGAIIGEPSEGHLAFGHRGRVEAEVSFRGRAGHASRPDLACSPHPSAARLVLGLPRLAHDEAPRIGRSTAAITQVRALPGGANVIPEELRLTVDWRNVPSEPASLVTQRVESLATECAEPGVAVGVRVPRLQMTSWTGAERLLERVSRPFGTDPEGEIFAHALSTLASGLGGDVRAIPWDFASDGGWLEAAGARVLGYGPGDMSCMHARDESVSLELLERAVMGNLLLLLSLDETLSRGTP